MNDMKKYSILVPTSMGLRLTPENSQPFHCTETFKMQATSAETNVASVSSYLGMPVKVLTAFVKGSPVSRFIKDNLQGRGMDYEGAEFEQGGPWGFRHQINMAGSGWGSRGPRVHNDRAGEVGRELSSEYFDFEKIFAEEGARIVHLSGLVAALSEKSSQFCLDVVRSAKKNGSLISFDLNYRASFWKGREKELGEAFAEIASNSDILIGNEEDFQLCLGIEGPESGGKGLEEKIDNFKEMIGRIQKAYPNAKWFGNTLREVVSANTHKWGAILTDSSDWEIISPREIGVLDRIGGGDGFVGGLLYGILKGWDAANCARFGWAGGALAATMLTDYAQPADEDQLWSIWEGNARVKR
ncbi:5-dehydro-2-deoxygluconokinase [Sedimentisphaera cyanobacteriorum]|uniref:5-dehydro-2-deoxygluconokinase n=1 Tax=Sedimentisphaera cyanobacteriorum TaxID=1940790 RepID=A0A1Q2HMT6_9BACT|nr:sugar kinase [Sedimentisphaera cyanobacteriorum]AQQ08777.1 5-dehydro-2-deoxygluconokinase [Sedimentisphaera cyanobacteriorum]